MLHLLRTEVFSGVDQDMGGDEAACDISLGLGLGLGGGESRGIGNEEKPVIQFRAIFPPGAKKGGDEEHGSKSLRRSSSEDEGGATDHKDPASNHRGGTRKKLRLTQEQSTLLEESFRWNNTLNQVQKQELAERLNLRPRQVEVWFQNRRARTKLKQTEVDCEFLKKCCENLSEENLRLRKDLEELRSTIKGSPFYTPLAVCPSCERAMATNGSGGGGCGGSSSSMSSEAVTVAEMPPELFN